jgi:hypothetical protein
MKNPLYLKIAIGSLLAIIIIAVIWGIGASHRIDKLQNDYNTSVGKNIIYEQEASKLTDSITKINSSYILLQHHNDDLVLIYTRKLNEKDKIISKYQKEHQAITNLSGAKSIEYFNSRVGSTAPVIIIPGASDTTFSIPVTDIRSANSLFVNNDELNELNANLIGRESDLIEINQGLKLEIKNRQSAVDRLTELVNNKDAQIQEYKTQTEDLNKIIKKQQRKNTIQKIGIGAAGVLGIILVSTL